MLIYLENIYLCGINNNQIFLDAKKSLVVICLKISTFVVSTTTVWIWEPHQCQLWFAWKYLPLWYQQQPTPTALGTSKRCDLLKNIYLCGINNNFGGKVNMTILVVICLKISTFVVSTTTHEITTHSHQRCDLLKNIYLCGINNNTTARKKWAAYVVICLKISTFVVSTTTFLAL